MQSGKGEDRIELMGRHSAALSLVELALGSFLHSLHIPFAGNLLSLNQGFMLCRASLEAREKGLRPVAYGISNIAAVLKSLAPAGKKLGPMLSLSAQGLLFTAGIWLLGVNLAGLMLAMALLSLWTFLQPLITYYLFFGKDLFAALAYLLERTGTEGKQAALVILAALVVAKIVSALGLAWLAMRERGAALERQLRELAESRGMSPLLPGEKKSGPAHWLAFQDLFRPLFLASLALTGAFVYFAEHRAGALIWVLLRPIAIGYIFFYFSRTLTLDRWLGRLHGTRFDAFARGCQSALVELRQFGRRES